MKQVKCHSTYCGSAVGWGREHDFTLLNNYGE